MSKTIVSFVLALLLANGLMANPVSVSDARHVAASFLDIGTEVLQTHKQPYETMYLFDVAGGGFILVSADDRVKPILGYSMTNPFPDEPLPANLRWWLDGCDAQIRAAMTYDALSQHPDWQYGGRSPKSVYESNVGPLLSTTWDQNPYYNMACPVVGGDTTLTGCVATAMGQVMKYWSWPETGMGSHSYVDSQCGVQCADFSATTYQWSLMPTVLTAVTDSVAVGAVATLLYHCGVAVEMMYGTLAQDGSGAYDIMEDEGLNFPCAENALRTYFKYSPSLYGVMRSGISDADWAALLKNEIDGQRPMLYGGSGFFGGHEFVCDGYDTNGFFHFNWGYNGWGDGFFSLSNLQIEGGYSFNSSQTAVVGIEPDMLLGSGAMCTVTAVASNSDYGLVQGGGTYDYRDTVVLTALPAGGCRFLRWSNGVKANPYPFLAHDVSLQAVFVVGDEGVDSVLSYVDDVVSDRAFYGLTANDRIGVRFLAFSLQGHDSVSAVEIYDYHNSYIVNVHIGGDTAPGAVVYSQPYTCTSTTFEWQHIAFDSLVAINPDSSLWITMQPTDEAAIFFGATGIISQDANWFSNDNGATWGHLSDYTPSSSWYNPNIAWLIRCITKGRNAGIVESVGKGTSLTVYPNPAHGVAYVGVPEQGGRLALYDAAGRRVAEGAISGAVHSLNVRGLPAGIYLLRYTTPDGIFSTRLEVQ